MATLKDTLLNTARQSMDADLVRINHSAIASLDRAQIAGRGGSDLTRGTNTFSLTESVRYAIALNSINYRFWDLHDGQMVRYQHGGDVGALAMFSAFGQAWARADNAFSNRHIPLTASDVTGVFGDIPDVDSRVIILNEVLLSPRLLPLSEQIAAACTHGAVLSTEHAQLLADAFPKAYADPLLKKAQLAISAVWLAARERGLMVTTDLTAFADYQIPRILRALRVIDYSKELAHKVDHFTPIVAGSAEEKAIRAASILAVELLSERHGVSSAAIDHFLWTRRNEAKEPFHLCETTLY